MAVNGTVNEVTFLVLDIGLSTGCAVMQIVRDSSSSPPTLEADLLHTAVHHKSNLRKGLAEIKEKYELDFVVIEPPLIMRGHLGNQLQEVIAISRDVFMGMSIIHVDPAQWKSTPFKKHPAPGLKTPHQRDAYRLGMWYAATRV